MLNKNDAGKLIIFKEISDSLNLALDRYTKEGLVERHVSKHWLDDLKHLNKITVDELCIILYTPDSYVVERTLEEKLHFWNNYLGSLIGSRCEYTERDIRNEVIDFAKEFGIKLEVGKYEE